jgi:hypothetical protein
VDDFVARRTFTLTEANALLPAVRERTRLALKEIGSLAIPVDELGTPGEGPETFHEEARRILAQWASDVIAMGVEVKGPWLVDFDSGGGYYCWRWPEESLEYFHGYSEGYTGRIRLQ